MLDAGYSMLVAKKRRKVMEYKSYRDLDIYQKALKLVIEIHEMTLYETKSLNDKDKYEYLSEEYDHLGRMITNFIKSVEFGHKTRTKIT